LINVHEIIPKSLLGHIRVIWWQKNTYFC